MTIQELIKTYEVALNGNDLEKILALYGSDPVFMPQHGPALVGRDAVGAGYRQVFDTIKLNIKFEVHETEEAGDWAWARTSSAGRTRILAAGVEVVVSVATKIRVIPAESSGSPDQVFDGVVRAGYGGRKDAGWSWTSTPPTDRLSETDTLI